MRFLGYAIMAMSIVPIALEWHWAFTLGLLALGVIWISRFPIEYPDDFEP
jgi:hypothetical protein